MEVKELLKQLATLLEQRMVKTKPRGVFWKLGAFGVTGVIDGGEMELEEAGKDRCRWPWDLFCRYRGAIVSFSRVNYVTIIVIVMFSLIH